MFEICGGNCQVGITDGKPFSLLVQNQQKSRHYNIYMCVHTKNVSEKSQRVSELKQDTQPVARKDLRETGLKPIYMTIMKYKAHLIFIQTNIFVASHGGKKNSRTSSGKAIYTRFVFCVKLKLF